jgi:hypothetical protein
MLSHLCDIVPSGCSVRTLACCAATANTCMVSAGHSTSGSSKACLVIKGMLYISVTCLLVSHLVTLVAQVSVRTSRVAPHSEHLHGECWSLSRSSKACLYHQACYTSVLHACWCDPLPSGVAVCVPRVLRHNSEHQHGECWSLSNQEATKLAWVIKE